ncbi:hypothetical protein L873DRAFT_1814638 [Choiromyces venosus 120613-1]|uniref:RRM domain-containing protein n=1 Tax=Choiromyces venosus 120613-1 TaxID=1336337 RepID=A0A3N4J7M5_9PEZI|nr:hypothetical protein L873DRAFT_1814638 [Choiromyces venosus 120613-1]
MKVTHPVNPLNQVYLQLIPPPRNIAESQRVYKALEKFGKIDMFRIVRYDLTTKLPAPRAHVIFSSTNAGSSLLSASPFEVPHTRVTVRASTSRFPHTAYIKTETRSHAIRSSSLLSRKTFVVGVAEAEKESGGLQEDTGGSFGGVESGADIISRLRKRFTGGFRGFDSVERGMVNIERKAEGVQEEEKKKKVNSTPMKEERKLQGGENGNVEKS